MYLVLLLLRKCASPFDPGGPGLTIVLFIWAERGRDTTTKPGCHHALCVSLEMAPPAQRQVHTAILIHVPAARVAQSMPMHRVTSVW